MISIIMGIYNCADTLTEALDSIANQTYKDWELIMCDDGSSDKTYELAKNIFRNILNIRLNYLDIKRIKA